MTRLTLKYAGIIASLMLASACSGGGNSQFDDDENIVNVYNWSDYIAPDTIGKFEAEFGIKVNYDSYAAAAVVDVKLLTGNSGYDVVIHSNERSVHLAPIGIFEKLDKARSASGGNPEAMMASMIKLRDETDEEIVTMLSEEQTVKYIEFRKEEMKDMENRMRRRQNSPDRSVAQ